LNLIINKREQDLEIKNTKTRTSFQGGSFISQYFDKHA